MIVSYQKTIIFFIICFVAGNVYGQRNHNLRILFTGDSIDFKKVNIQFYQGYQVAALDKGSNNLLDTNIYSSLKLPVVEILYFSEKQPPSIFRFFLNKQTSSLAFNYNSVVDGIFLQKEEGAIDFNNAGQKEFELFARKELLLRTNLETENNHDLSNVKPEVLKEHEMLSNSIKIKGLEFAKRYPNLPYSNWMLMYELVGKPIFSKEELLSVYNKNFRKRLRNTFEEKYILNQIDKNRLSIGTHAPSLELPFTDVQGTSYTLKSLDNKLVIVTVWATWCVPCVAEIPKLKEFYLAYKNKIEIVAFSTDSDLPKLKNFVNLKKLDWINVFNRTDLCHMYGSDLGIPQVYLLGQDGKIIYSRTKSQDYNLELLGQLLSQKLN